MMAATMAVLLLSACNDNDAPVHYEQTAWKTEKVAVVLPLNGNKETHWKRVLELCAANLKEAFDGNAQGVELEFEWYEEACDTLQSLAQTLSLRNDITAVIGGEYSANAAVLEAALCRTGKPFFTIATNGELIRAYASVKNLWAMTETDITQCEVLLSKAYYYGARKVALIAKEDNAYGKTFVDWFAFQAEGLGMELVGIVTYTDGTLEERACEAANLPADFAICVPSAVEDIEVIERAFRNTSSEKGQVPRCLYSDIAYTEELLNRGWEYENLEGVVFGSDPTTGFDIYMEERYSERPIKGASQIYDAAMLIGLAAYKQLLEEEDMTLTEALRKVVDGREEVGGGWMKENMRQVVEAMNHGSAPDVCGASGRLNFDAKVYTNVLNTVYHGYKIYRGKFIFLDYSTSDGDKRSNETLAGWNWRTSHMQDFEETSEDIYYPPRDKRWALLVAGSSGWNNYRHQADVLNMYRILKRNGYDDEHIVLVMEDDIAHHAKNPNKGVIKVRPDGENLYEDVTIDYKTSDLNPEDLKQILCGEKRPNLPHVIEADGDDNVLLFWSGHGGYRQLSWLDRRTGFTAETASEIFASMHEKQCYRKFLMMIETCYSGSVAEVCEGIPGMLAFTATNNMEPSKADVYNYDLGVWMSNRFTATLHECLAATPSITFSDLYYRMFVNTVGSHVMVYNADYFGNMYKEGMADFFQ